MPRAKYTLDFYADYVRYHGKTNDFKMMYKDIDEIVKLSKTERDQTMVLFVLRKHLTLG